MFIVKIAELLVWESQMTDPTSRQRGRPTETRQQLSENNLRTESNIWSQVPEWARYLDILTDWSSVLMWLQLRLRLRAEMSVCRETACLSGVERFSLYTKFSRERNGCAAASWEILRLRNEDSLETQKTWNVSRWKPLPEKQWRSSWLRTWSVCFHQLIELNVVTSFK
jgi:hypothetical protein